MLDSVALATTSGSGGEETKAVWAGDAVMSGSGAADEWDLVVPEIATELLAELRRHGVRPGQRLHLRAVPDALADLSERFSIPVKRPPFRSTEGMLAHLGPAPSMEDFEEASRLAIAESDADPTLPE